MCLRNTVLSCLTYAHNYELLSITIDHFGLANVYENTGFVFILGILVWNVRITDWQLRLRALWYATDCTGSITPRILKFNSAHGNIQCNLDMFAFGDMTGVVFITFRT